MCKCNVSEKTLQASLQASSLSFALLEVETLKYICEVLLKFKGLRISFISVSVAVFNAQKWLLQCLKVIVFSNATGF